MFRVIPTSRQIAARARARATRAADSRACADMTPAGYGLPRTAREWTALVRIASGEVDIPCVHYRCLEARGLVERRSGVPALTRHGRLALGLPE